MLSLLPAFAQFLGELGVWDSHTVLSNFELKNSHVLPYSIPEELIAAPLYIHLFVRQLWPQTKIVLLSKYEIGLVYEKKNENKRELQSFPLGYCKEARINFFGAKIGKKKQRENPRFQLKFWCWAAQ